MAHRSIHLPIDDLIERYNKGDTLVSIAKLYSCYPQTIAHRLREAGVVIDSQRRGDQFGEKNHQFRDGLSRATVWRKITDAVVRYDIDSFKCGRCSTRSNSDVRLNVHHKDRNRANNSKENLEVLCPSCHAKEHYNERGIGEDGRICG